MFRHYVNNYLIINVEPGINIILFRIKLHFTLVLNAAKNKKAQFTEPFGNY